MSMEVKNNAATINDDMKAFNADVELANYRHQVETGTLPKEEMEARAELLDFLGVQDSK